MEMLLDAVEDNIRILPFLFGAFCLIELLEKYSVERRNKMLIKFQKAGPVIGSVFGCIPQCGFSVVAANLYSGGIISAGTLLAVFMSTSDEAVLIMMSAPGHGKEILRLILVKVLIAVCVGYFVDIFFVHRFKKESGRQDLCGRETCGCKEEGKILLPAWKHTIRLFGYLLVFTAVINLVVEGIGSARMEQLILNGSIFQPFLTALIGLIPNCAASVLLTELYMKGILSFASTVAGLCASAGIGLMVLFRVNRPMKENWKLVGILYAFSVLSGVILGVVKMV